MTNVTDVFEALKYNRTVSSDGACYYHNNQGQLHREGGPAVIWPSGAQRWYHNGKLHRIDGPAVKHANGAVWWYQDDKLHREDGPAVEYANGTHKWLLNGLLHRTDGPAIEYHDGTKEWYINCEKLTEAEFLAATQPAVEMTVADVEKLVGKRVKIVK